MAVRTFDPRKVSVAVGLTPISGFADGTAIQVSRSNDTFSKVVGTDGVTSRSKSNDRSGEITLTLAQTSPSNDVLNAIALLDEIANSGIVPITVQDFSGRSKYVTAFGWIRKQPDAEFGKEISNREWVFDCADLIMTTGGNKEAE